MDSVLLSAASSPFLRSFFAVRVELKSGPVINVIDGSGVVTFGGMTFTGQDATFGTLASANSVAERVASEAPQFSFQLMPPSNNAVGTLNDPVQQGSRVYAWWGLVNDQTGAVIGNSELLWSGRLDYVKTNHADHVMTTELVTVSAFDRLFASEEGQRLNGEWHKSIWAGETGLDFVYDATSEVYWGQEAPAKSAPVYYGNGGFGGFGGFSGGYDGSGIGNTMGW